MLLGAKLRRLRLQRGLTQSEVADRCELSKSFISLLERDQTSITLNTLEDILQALGSDLPSFFHDPINEQLVFRADDIFIKEDPELLKGCVRWLVPQAQKMNMEPILLEMAPGGCTEEDDPHEGEEFGYVLAGVVRLEIGDRKEIIHRGESFCYKPTMPHKLTNTGKSVCRIIWISTPPSF